MGMREECCEMVGWEGPMIACSTSESENGGVGAEVDREKSTRRTRMPRLSSVWLKDASIAQFRNMA